MAGYKVIYLEKKRVKPGIKHSERKRYLDSLCYNSETNTLGSITEFNNLIGFSSVTSVLGPDGKVIPAIIRVEDNFKLPESLLLDSLHAMFSTYGVAKFEIPIRDVVCNLDGRFSYNTEHIAEQFVTFLRSKYRELEIRVVKKERVNHRSIALSVLDDFYTSLDFDRPDCTVMKYVSRPLTTDEVDNITKVLSDCLNYPFRIIQYTLTDSSHGKAKKKYVVEIEYC